MASGHPFSTSQVKKAKEAINILSSILGEQSDQGPSTSSASTSTASTSRAEKNGTDIDSKGRPS